MIQSQDIFIWNIGNTIIGKVLGEVIQRGNENIAKFEHILKWNLQVCYPALFKSIQSIIFYLHPIDQGTISRVHKQLQSLFKTNNTLIVDILIIWIPLKGDLLLKGYLGPVIKQVYVCCVTIYP